MTARTAQDYLREAREICIRLGGAVWFVSDARFDARVGETVSFYKIFRRSMGLVATRATPAALVSYLRKQLPAGG